MEQNSDFYNNIYKEGGSKQEYFKEPEESIYYPIWNQIIFGLPLNSKILDLGCGVGQLANLLIKRKRNYIRGIDFSEVAIKKAKESNKGHEDKFIVSDLYDENCYKIDYDIVLICEVLEHIEDDLSILKRLKKDKRIYLTVPNYMSKGHVRCFENTEQIIDRYNPYIRMGVPSLFKIGNKGNIIYLISGLIK